MTKLGRSSRMGMGAFGRVATDCVRLPVEVVKGVVGGSGDGARYGDDQSAEVCMVVSEGGVWKMEVCAPRPGSDANGMLNAQVGELGGCAGEGGHFDKFTVVGLCRAARQA
jgi:hypothetical protein